MADDNNPTNAEEDDTIVALPTLIYWLRAYPIKPRPAILAEQTEWQKWIASQSYRLWD